MVFLSRPLPNVLALSAAMNACGQGQRPEPWVEVLRLVCFSLFFLLIGSWVAICFLDFSCGFREFHCHFLKRPVVFGWLGWLGWLLNGSEEFLSPDLSIFDHICS